MFKHLSKDASEGNRSVVCCQRFIALFEGGNEGACLSGGIYQR